MIHPRIFRQTCVATLIGQLALVLAGYVFASLPENLVLLGRLLVAGGGGYWYGLEYGTDTAPCALGGAVCGGIVVLPAMLLAAWIGVCAGSMVPVSTGACMLAGALGGWLGYWASERRGGSY